MRALRNVVAERGVDHVVSGLRRETRRGATVIARPAQSSDIGILHAPAESALRSLVNLVPETKSCFPNEARVASASAAGRRNDVRGRRVLDAATAVIGERRAVAANLIEL